MAETGSDDEGMTPEHLLEHPEVKGMVPELPGLDSELLSHVSRQEFCSQESSCSDKESLTLESIGSSDKEGGGSSSSQEGSGSDKEGSGSGSDSDKDARLENVKRRKLEKLPEIAEEAEKDAAEEAEEEIAEEAEEEDVYQKAKVWKEWRDRCKKKAAEFDWHGWAKRNLDPSHKTREEIQKEHEEHQESVPSPPSNLREEKIQEEPEEDRESVPSPPSDLRAVGGLDDVLKSFFVHDVDPKLWEKYVAECQESEGFDVVTYPGPSPLILIRPVTSYVDIPELHQHLIKLATKALEEKQPGYKFLHIEWVTRYACAGYVYFITFRAQGADSSDDKSFQAKVYDGIGEVEVDFCRPKVVKT